jgi:NADH-quinone oxidoreductase subunit M
MAEQHAFPFLTTLVLMPAGAALLTILIPRRNRGVVRWIGLLASFGELGIAAAVLDLFRTHDGGYQMVSTHPWVSSLGISWNLGVDGISLFLVLLTAFLFVVALVGANEARDQKAFTAWVLILESACLGSFLSIDLLLFFLFFELTLVPVYFLIGGWGLEGRAHAALKFFIYTFAGSAVMLVGILSLVSIHAGETGVTTFDVRALANTHLSGTAGVLLSLAFLAAFAVKAPIFPFHTWSPDAYREAPVAGSVLLAGIMAKIGTYGIIRFNLGLFAHATVVLAPLFLTLGVSGIVYGAIVAAVQRDLKRLVAFSSLSHIGFIVVGAFALSGEAVSGAVLQMVNHGILIAALFLLIAMISRRGGTLSVAGLGGLQRKAPKLAAVFIVVVLATIGVPGLNSFIGEFLILAGTFLVHRWWAIAAVSGTILAAVYFLWAYQQLFHGPEGELAKRPFAEINWRETFVVAPLIGLIVFLGVWPKPVLDRITPSVDRLVNHVEVVGHARLPVNGRPTLTSHAKTQRP